MSERDLVRELKENIKELTQDRDDALAKVKTKESRMRQVMIKLAVSYTHLTLPTKASV